MAVNIGVTIYNHLSANSGTIPVRSDAIPKTNATLPAITYRVIDTVVNESLAGVVGLFTSRIEIVAHGDNRSDADTTAELVRQIIQSIPKHDTAEGAYVYDVSSATGQYYMYTPPSERQDRRFMTGQDYFISYRPEVLAEL